MAQKINVSQITIPKTTDANGWIVYDYGSHKVATKSKTWSATVAGGGTAFVTISGNDSPVGYTSGFTVATPGFDGNAGSFVLNAEPSAVTPTSGWVFKNFLSGTTTASGRLNYIVIF